MHLPLCSSFIIEMCLTVAARSAAPSAYYHPRSRRILTVTHGCLVTTLYSGLVNTLYSGSVCHWRKRRGMLALQAGFHSLQRSHLDVVLVRCEGCHGSLSPLGFFLVCLLSISLVSFAGPPLTIYTSEVARSLASPSCSLLTISSIHASCSPTTPHSLRPLLYLCPSLELSHVKNEA